MTLREALGARLAEYRKDPVCFVREVFGVEPDAWQIDALTAMVTNTRVGAKACKGPGKTAWLAWGIWWFLTTREDSKGSGLSISEDNLRDCLWAELALWLSKSKLLQQYFCWYKTRIESKESPDTWWFSARTCVKGADKNQQANSLAGLHNVALVVAIDEAGDIPDGVMAAVEAILSTGGDKLIMMAGNPTSLDGSLYRASTKDRDLWHMITITGDPDDPKRSPRVKKEWAQEQIAKWGRDNSYVKVNVFGEFPDRANNALLGPDDVERAMARRYREDGSINRFSRRIGADMASETGNDRIVLFPRQGPQWFKPVILRHASSETVANTILLMLKEWPDATVYIDRTGGWAAEVPYILRQAGAKVVEVDFADRSPPDQRYFNMRSYMWMEMADAIRSNAAIPDVPNLATELIEPQFRYDGGKFRLEEKKEIKKRLGFSPDLGDGACLTYAAPEIVIPTDTQLARGAMPGAGKAKSEYQPVMGM